MDILPLASPPQAQSLYLLPGSSALWSLCSRVFCYVAHRKPSLRRDCLPLLCWLLSLLPLLQQGGSLTSHGNRDASQLPPLPPLPMHMLLDADLQQGLRKMLFKEEASVHASVLLIPSPGNKLSAEFNPVEGPDWGCPVPCASPVTIMWCSSVTEELRVAWSGLKPRANPLQGRQRELAGA